MRARALLVALVLSACGPNSVIEVADGGHTDVDSGGGEGCTASQKCSGRVLQVCVNGEWSDQVTCPDVCDQTLGCVACDPDLGNACLGTEVHACNADGSMGALVETCAVECDAGYCVDPCAMAETSRSYIGCEYWPVDLDNAIEVIGAPIYGSCLLYGSEDLILATLPVCSAPDDPMYPVQGLCDYDNDCSQASGATCETMQVCILNAQQSPFAVVVANPSTTGSATVTLANATGTSHDYTVAPGAVETIYPQEDGFSDQSLDASGVGAKAYRLTSSRPIVAYQFNPLDNVGVFSNDASLLLPAHAFDVKYYAVSYPTLTRRPSTNDYNGYVTVVATQATTVTITPSAGVRAGNGVTAIAAGATQSVALDAFEVLNLEAVADGDLTGTLIVADQPVGVYVGHEATVIAETIGATTCCADHLEDQLFPASTWGMRYAVARSQARAGEKDLLRIVAQEDGTSVSLDPSPSASTCGASLSAGAFCEAWIAADTEINADKPILVGHFLLSTDGTAGDPAMAFAIPTEQYRETYTFLVPSLYDQSYVSLVSSGTVTLDGTDVTGQLNAFGDGTFKGGRIAVNAGAHTLECPDKCGVEVYGYSEAVSYLYAGGLDLEQIVVE